LSKVNVNSATREDLVDLAGLRPDVADAVLGFRREHGRITDARALEELPGVGPATIDQLRKVLDFGDRGGNGSDQGKSGEKGAARSGAEMARETTETGARTASTAARDGVEVARRVAGAGAETGREAVSRTAEGVAELGRLWVDLLGEQTRHNLEVVTALGRTVRWDEVVQAQGDFVRVSLERLTELNRRYLEIVHGVMETTSAAVDRARKAG
jgi:competence ComEA-like helix-hairpin-helix protein